MPAAFGSVANPYKQDPFMRITAVHWPSSAPVVLLQLEGQIGFPNVGGPQYTFKTAPVAGDTVTINGVVIKFGLSVGGQVAIGAGADDNAAALADYLNKPPLPVDRVTASATGAVVALFYDTDKLTLEASGAAIEVNGGSFSEIVPLDIGVTITADKYKGLALYDPKGSGEVFKVRDDLIFLVYTEKFTDPITWGISNTYVSRLRRSYLINFKVAKQAEIDIFANAPNNYIFVSPSAFPIRLLQPTDQIITASAFPAGTEFKVGSDGTLATVVKDLKPIWTFTKTISIRDDRGAPAGSSAAVDTYNLFRLPFPYAVVKINKAGEVV